MCSYVCMQIMHISKFVHKLESRQHLVFFLFLHYFAQKDVCPQILHSYIVKECASDLLAAFWVFSGGWAWKWICIGKKKTVVGAPHESMQGQWSPWRISQSSSGVEALSRSFLSILLNDHRKIWWTPEYDQVLHREGKHQLEECDFHRRMAGCMPQVKWQTKHESIKLFCVL